MTAACSLAPGADRLAVTVEIDLDSGGEPRAVTFYRSRIRSDARLDYDQLDEFFAGRAQPPPAVAEPLALARRAAAALAARRPFGSLEIESFEPEFSFDADGAVTGARSRAPDRGPQADRASDDPHQRAGRSAARATWRPDSVSRPRAARAAADRPPDRAAGGA